MPGPAHSRGSTTVLKGLDAYVQHSDKAFRQKNQASHEEFVAALEASLQQVEKAKQQARAVTTKYAEIIDHPADMEILYQLNVRTVLSFDVARQWLREIVSFHEGKPYWRHVF